MKALRKESSPKVYFEKTQETTDKNKSGFKELRPLAPFIISGGQNTEQFYFKKVSVLTKYHFNILPGYFGKESQFTETFPQWIDEIINQDSDARVFCVFDIDTIADNKSNQKKYTVFLNNILAHTNSGKVTLCPSMPCFEYWLLLHFENTAKLMKSNAVVSNYLSKHMKSLFPKSDKAFSKMMKSQKYLDALDWKTLICTNGNLERAISTAKQNYEEGLENKTLDKQSYTLVFKAFEKR